MDYGDSVNISTHGRSVDVEKTPTNGYGPLYRVADEEGSLHLWEGEIRELATVAGVHGSSDSDPEGSTGETSVEQSSDRPMIPTEPDDRGTVEAPEWFRPDDDIEEQWWAACTDGPATYSKLYVLAKILDDVGVSDVPLSLDTMVSIIAASGHSPLKFLIGTEDGGVRLSWVPKRP